LIKLVFLAQISGDVKQKGRSFPGTKKVTGREHGLPPRFCTLLHDVDIGRARGGRGVYQRVTTG